MQLSYLKNTAISTPHYCTISIDISFNVYTRRYIEVPGHCPTVSKASESDDCLRDEVCTRLLLFYQSHQSVIWREVASYPGHMVGGANME